MVHIFRVVKGEFGTRKHCRYRMLVGVTADNSTLLPAKDLRQRCPESNSSLRGAVCYALHFAGLPYRTIRGCEPGRIHCGVRRLLSPFIPQFHPARFAKQGRIWTFASVFSTTFENDSNFLGRGRSSFCSVRCILQLYARLSLHRCECNCTCRIRDRTRSIQFKAANSPASSRRRYSRGLVSRG